jgi:hypothetical protein
MSRRTILLTNVQGNSSIGTFSAQLPMGLDYLAFYAEDTSGTVLIANITNVRHYMNSEIVRDITGVQQDSFNITDKNNGFVTDNILSIHLDMLRMKTVKATYGPTMNTLSPGGAASGNKTITSSRLEIWTNGSNTPAWTLWADVDDSSVGGPGYIERIKAFQNNNVGTTEKSYATVMPFGTPDVRYWRRILVSNLSQTGGATTISLARLLRSSQQNEIYRRDLAIDKHILADYQLRQLSTNIYFLLDGTETGIPETFDTMMPSNVAGQVVSVGTMDFRLTATAAQTVDLLQNTLGTF